MNITLSLPVGYKTKIHSNPQDVNNNPVTVPTPCVWGVDNGLVSLNSDGGDQNVGCIVTAGTTIGVSTVTVTDGVVVATITITITALPLDHFAPTYDPPTPA
jgi:hypothetical protein